MIGSNAKLTVLPRGIWYLRDFIFVGLVVQLNESQMVASKLYNLVGG